MRWKSFWERITNWELWPFNLRYLGISPVWFWYCLRSGTAWFFTPSNPTLTFGGFEGESKREMYEQLPLGSFPKTIFIYPDHSFEQVMEQVTTSGFTFPFIVKPDVGMAGILVRKIESVKQLQEYHYKIPVTYIVQAIIHYPIEYSVFYYRFPDQQKGVITGFLEKTPLRVIGDGKNSLQQLVKWHPKAKHRLKELELRHAAFMHNIIPPGESFYLSYAANLNRGASFINLKTQIDEQLHQVFDRLNLYSKTFYYGRYDLKATSVEDLKEGKNFSILEYNGSGAEPNHIYHSGYSLGQAYKEILLHWKVLFQISRYNHKKGVPYWSFLKGWFFLRASNKHFATLKKMDW